MFTLAQNVFTNTYNKPDIYLCEVDGARICKLNTTDTKLSLKFSSLSELSFNVDRTYIDTLTGEKKVNMHYDRIEHPRQILIDDVGCFQIQGPDMSSDGFRESKTVTAYSSEYALSQKYITNLRINTGEVDSVEVIYAEEQNSQKTIVPVSFYNSAEPRLSLLDIVLEDIPDWKIGHIDPSLTTLSRKFDIDRMSVYDFLMNEVCQAFNCYIAFDTLKKEINFYAEAVTAKFLTGRYQKIYTVSPPMNEVGTVSIDGYKTTKWMYRTENGWQNGTPSDNKTASSPVGTLVLVDNPGKDGLMIEVVEKSQSRWETDVFVTFENLSNEMNVSYNADDIITKLVVTYGDDLDIREINMGSPYIMDLSYFYTVEWMGQDLYDAYTAYLKKSQTSQTQYTKNSQEMVELSDQEYFEEHRLSMEYSIAQVSSETIGTYYVRDYNNGYYYREVTLPDDYNASTTYYTLNGTNLNPEKVSNLYEAIKDNFMNGTTDALTDLNEQFKFMEDGSYDIAYLVKYLVGNRTIQQKKTYVLNFLKQMWDEIGRTPLKSLYQTTYKTIQSVNIEWAQKNVDPYGNETYHENYPWYYATLVFLESIETAIKDRTAKIEQIQASYDRYQQANIDIANSLILSNNFTEKQLVRLNAFIKEDELHIDDIIETECDTLADSFKLKQAAMEEGRIELNNRCKPKLQFSATMANIFAIPNFKPIIHQFQLGNVIKVGIRKDYIKQARLLQIDVNLDDFSDFEVQFGELIDLRTQSDVHADLLAQAISAGKTVASSEGVWNSGADMANSIDLKIQQGLISATNSLKSMDSTQAVEWDDYGIHIRKWIDDSKTAYDPRQAWLVNNALCYTSDNWTTTKSLFGEYQLPGDKGTRWGVLSECVDAGLITGSLLIGGEMKLGPNTDGSYNFTVDPKGHMVAQSSDIVGKITADSGNIRGNLEISGSLKHTNGNYTVQLRAVQDDKTVSVFHIAEKSGYSIKYPFRVNGDGSLTATKADITGDITTSNLQADGGKIGGFDITDKYIAKTKKAYGDTSSGVYIGTDGIGLGAQKFYVTSAGKLVATDAEIKGKIETSNITATGGTIGGFDITSSYLSKTKKSYSDANDGVYIGTTGIGLGKGVFYVKSDGSMVANNITTNNIKATGGTIGGFTITSSYIAKTKKTYSDTSSGVYLGTDGIGLGAGKFYVTSAGKLTATDATVKGKIETEDITAIGGTIGGFTITSSYLAKTKKSYNDANDGVYIGTTGIGLGKGVFYVKSNGSVVANNITTSGIKATGGTIGGWTIEQNIISGQNGAYEARMSKSGIGVAGNVVFGVYNGIKWSAYIDGVGKLYASGANIEGTIKSSDADIEGKIVANSGTIGGCKIINGKLTIQSANIESINADTITVGKIKADQIDGLPASQIISGVFSTSRIPDLNADKITAGTLTINDSFNIKTAGGAYLENTDNGIRIYCGNRNPYFIVSDSSVYSYAGGTYFYIQRYSDGSGNGATLYSPYGIRLSTGRSGLLNGTWYSSSAISTTSDENKKNTIIEISDSYEKFFDNIGCYTFKYNDGTSDRLHCGFISQRIKDSLDIAGVSTQDFGGLVIQKNEDDTQDWYIRYAEFVPLNTWQIQKLKSRVSTLEDEINLLKQKIEGVV